MKKVVAIVVMVLVPVFAAAQSANIEKIMSKYSGQEGVTLVNISPELFQIVNGLEIEDIDDADFPFDKLSNLKVLAVENEALLAGGNFYDEVTNGLNLSDFAEIISVKDGDEDVRIWLHADGKQIKELFLVVSSPDEGVVVYIEGDFNMSDIEGLTESIGGIKELEALGEL